MGRELSVRVEMAIALKSAEMVMVQASLVMLLTALGVSRAMFLALAKYPEEMATYNWLVRVGVVMCSTAETNASKDPGHSHHHPPQPTECLGL